MQSCNPVPVDECSLAGVAGGWMTGPRKEIRDMRQWNAEHNSEGFRRDGLTEEQAESNRQTAKRQRQHDDDAVEEVRRYEAMVAAQKKDGSSESKYGKEDKDKDGKTSITKEGKTDA